MSGGFFRGTSADQDTRFSNKQAKLLKTQKFCPELDHLVDMTKVKMDVIRPWIAKRVTELLGFEDEVLINLIYGLLEGKEVDGKPIQIQLTGFMEKNTGKFMRELWGLLLSAQNNASGIPQQLLDAKEEEIRNKKAENDRITQEILKMKEREGKELEQERQKRMDGESGNLKTANTVLGSGSKHSFQRALSVHSEEERDAEARRGPRTKSRRSSSPSRSSSKSASKSESSKERQKSMSVSVSSESQRHSRSPKRRYHSSHRRSMSPARRYSPRKSSPPLRRRSTFDRSPARRSISPRRRYSPRKSSPPLRRRSPFARRHSPSISRRRSPYLRRRSPSFVRRRSPSPLSHRSRSPFRRRSPVPSRRRSPSPSRYRSPIKHRSISPTKRSSPSPVRRRSPPHRSPRLRRSRSPYRSLRPSYQRRRSSSRETAVRTNGFDSKRHHNEYESERTRERRSPAPQKKISDPGSSWLPKSSRSPHVSRGQNDSRDHDVQSDKSPDLSESPSRMRRTSPKKNRARSISGSPVRLTGKRITCHDSPATNSEGEQISPPREDVRQRNDSSRRKGKDPRTDTNQKKSDVNDYSIEEYSPNQLAVNYSPATKEHVILDLKKKKYEEKSDMDLPKGHVQVSKSSEEIEYGPGSIKGKKHSVINSERQSPSKSVALRESDYETILKKSKRKMEQSTQQHTTNSDSEETDMHRHRSQKRRHKKNDKYKRDSDDSSEPDSEIEDKKEAKRRRKEERRLRKEERRRRREERHRKKLERRAGKKKGKSELEKDHNDASKSEDDVAFRRGTNAADVEEADSEQKRLEIELREKALETLRAKKRVSN